MTAGIGGAGRVAQALGRQLRESGQRVVGVASRSIEHARVAAEFIGTAAVPYEELRAERILIAVPDNAIREVAGRIPESRVTLHTCGAYGAELLRGVRAGDCGALHPLQTFATPEAGYGALRGCAVAIDGDAGALAWAEEIAELLGGPVLRVAGESRAVYHAAAVMASNHVVAVMDAAVGLLERAGVPEEAARRAVGPLARTAVENLIERGAAGALTGPVERGDAGTVRRHREALREMPETVGALYRAASLQALAIAIRRGLNPEAVAAVGGELRDA